MTSVKKEIQEKKYDYPYHYMPFIGRKGFAYRGRFLKWGFEYLCYIMHAKEIIDPLNASSLLDVGCGTGRFISLLSPEIKRILGVDLSPKAILFAKAFFNNNREGNIEFLESDVSNINEEFDVVTAIEVLEHVPDQDVHCFLKTLEERVKPNGYILISVPTVNYRLIEKHYRHYNISLLEQQVNEATNSLKVIKVDYVYRETKATRLYNLFTANKLYFLESRHLNRIYWNYIWRKLRFSREREGKHMVVLIKKYH
jgi:2-polyprenyl-3-methyl-5-hydroxy-6-metoxy-1,4-benzoquinol methylase